MGRVSGVGGVVVVHGGMTAAVNRRWEMEGGRTKRGEVVRLTRSGSNGSHESVGLEIQQN